MTVMTATTNSETGEQEVTAQPSVKQQASSEDYAMMGVTARTEGGNYRTARTADELQPTDIVTLPDGMQVTVADAKQFGVLGQLFPDTTPSETSGGDAPAADAEPSDPTVSNLQAALDAGEITASEAQVYDTINAELELSGIDHATALEAIEMMAKGEALELPGDNRTMLESVSAQVTQAATAAAQSELGPDAFKQLQAWAGTSSEVNEALRGFAAKRAMGDRSGGTWSAFYTEVSDFMAGR